MDIRENIPQEITPDITSIRNYITNNTTIYFKNDDNKGVGRIKSVVQTGNQIKVKIQVISFLDERGLPTEVTSKKTIELMLPSENNKIYLNGLPMIPNGRDYEEVSTEIEYLPRLERTPESNLYRMGSTDVQRSESLGDLSDVDLEEGLNGGKRRLKKSKRKSLRRLKKKSKRKSLRRHKRKSRKSRKSRKFLRRK